MNLENNLRRVAKHCLYFMGMFTALNVKSCLTLSHICNIGLSYSRFPINIKRFTIETFS